MIRPKSAVYLSLPCHFGSKEQSLKTKAKFKQQVSTLESSKCLTSNDMNCETEIKRRKYQDEGPSFLGSIKRSYIESDYQQKENRKKLKACRKVPRSLLENIRKSLVVISAETCKLNKFISENKSPQDSMIKQRRDIYRRFTFKKRSTKRQNFFKTESAV